LSIYQTKYCETTFLTLPRVVYNRDHPEPSPESFQQGCFAFSRGGLDILKLAKTPLIYSVSCFSLGDWSFVWGGKPTKAPCGDGTGTTNLLEAESYFLRACGLMRRATSLIHTSEIKVLLKYPLNISVLTIKIFCNVKTLIMLMLFLKQAGGQLRSQPEIFFGPNVLTLSEQQYFVRYNASQSTKKKCQKFGGP